MAGIVKRIFCDNLFEFRAAWLKINVILIKLNILHQFKGFDQIAEEKHI